MVALPPCCSRWPHDYGLAREFGRWGADDLHGFVLSRKDYRLSFWAARRLQWGRVGGGMFSSCESEPTRMGGRCIVATRLLVTRHQQRLGALEGPSRTIPLPCTLAFWLPLAWAVVACFPVANPDDWCMLVFPAAYPKVRGEGFPRGFCSLGK